MNKIILAVLLTVASLGANATGDMHICSLKSSVYEAAAAWRDSNVPPETAFKMAKQYKEVEIEDLKKIINTVYFNPDFQRAGGYPLRQQIMDLCLNGPKNWKPVQ